MEFDKRKAATLASLGSTVTDKSPKGTLDTPIIPLLKTLNLHPSYFTTSSCSGRISILSQPTATATATANKKAKGGSWLFVTHDSADPDSVLNLLFPSEPTHTPPTHPHDLVFRFEPLIIAIECKDISSAQSLISIAISCGFRESGITNTHKRVIIAIRCSIRLEVPLGNTSRIMISPEYVRYLVGLANEKMDTNRKRIDRFLGALQKNGFLVPEIGQSGDRIPLSVAKDETNEDANSDRSGDKTQNGALGVPGCSLYCVRMAIVGEPLERLFLWGHTACMLPDEKKLLVFGGFGGMGRHARRNDCLLLDPLCGTLKALDVEETPSPRLGHTSCMIGDRMYVIGGRADPVNILNDVWVLNISEKKWMVVGCSGSVFPPRHRHATAVVGSRIYVFGGLYKEVVFSSLHVLDTESFLWHEICANGELPSARHSHSMVACGSHLYMFGGYNGEEALGDLYSFDVQTCLWKKEKTSGRIPHSRFSHSMFVYRNYLGIIGGCPLRKNYQELELLDLRSLSWRHVMLTSICEDLFVRATANIVGDDLVMIGGGASCYAFGTKFSEPMIINLLLLMSSENIHTPSESKDRLANREDLGKLENIQVAENGCVQTLTVIPDSDSLKQTVASHWVLQLERKYAKFGKDILKKFGWLDLRRKVYTQKDCVHVCFPVTEKFCAIFDDRRQLSEDATEGLFDLCTESLTVERVSLNEVFNIFKKCCASLLVDEVVKVRRSPSSPLKIMSEAVASLIKSRELSPQLLEQLPSRWERLGDIVVLPATSFKDPLWDSVREELWPTVAKSLGAHRLARQGRIAPTGTRDSGLEILVGDNGWVEHRENGILYSFDATKCMFSWGNLSEKLRMARLDCKDEIVVDLFAGIGYFALPFLVRAKAKLVFACEWNPYAVEALRRNLQANSIAERCIILEGDNRITAPNEVADRVCLGLLPTSEGSWVTAVRALRVDGGTLHVHANVKDTEEDVWTEHVSKSICEIAISEGRCWEVSIEHVERVKWYAPHIRHLVVDVRCRQIQP